VTISDWTAGETIYYTTNGIRRRAARRCIPADRGLCHETIKAIATSTGLRRVRQQRGRNHQPAGSHAYLQPRGRNLFHDADGDHQRRNLRRDHLLHHNGYAHNHFVCYSSPVMVAASETLEAIATATAISLSRDGFAVCHQPNRHATFNPGGVRTPCADGDHSDGTSGVTTTYTPHKRNLANDHSPS